MKGAREYLAPMRSAYKKLGLTRIADDAFYGNHVLFVFDRHARGTTLKIYIIDDEDEIMEKGLRASKKLEVYGIISGQPGWTETYGWLIKGKWCEFIENTLSMALEIYKDAEKEAKRLKEQIEKNKRIEKEKLAKSLEKYF